MFKSVIAALAAAPIFSLESILQLPLQDPASHKLDDTASYPDGEYSSAVTDLHVGFEGGSGKVGYYVQGGPAFVHSEVADDTETELSGKVGLSYAATEKDLGIYGEVNQVLGITAGEDSDGDEIIDWGAKVGVKLSSSSDSCQDICYNIGVWDPLFLFL